MMNLKKTLAVLTMIVLTTCITKADQFNISDGDIAALKAAINTANANNKPDTIHLAPFGMYKFSTADNHFLMSGANALPPFRLDGNTTNSLVIFGNGATFMRDPVIDELRLLYAVDVTVNIYDLNLIAGTTLPFDNEGGAIMINSARVTLENCLLKDNRATNGGAVYLVGRGTFIARNCTFTGNVASAGTGSAMASTYGDSYFYNCVVVHNRCLNVNVPTAIYNFIPLNSNTAIDNIFLKNCIVAKNIYDNPTSPNHGKEFDLGGAVYTSGGNVIGSYPVVMQVTLPTFRQGTPGANSDYVGTETVYVDPLLGTLDDHGLFTNSYNLLTGSPALQNNAGIKNAGIPAVASNGIVPAQAYHGDVITMTGINLSAVNKVQFAGSPTTTTGITSTNRTVTVPVHANAISGQVLLMTPVPQFIFTPQKLKIKTITTPAAPSNLQGTAASTSSVSLTWNDVEDEDNYQVEYKKSTDAGYSVLQTVGGNVTTYLAQNLLCSNMYDFRIIALGRGTQSPPSDVVSVKPNQLPAPVATPSSTEKCTGQSIAISAPAGFSAYHWNDGSITEVVDVQNSGDYSVQVTDAGGCISDFSQPASVVFMQAPAISGTIDGSDAVLEGSTGNSYSLTDPGNVTFNWLYNGTGASLTPDNNIVNIDFASGATSGTLSVTITGECGTSAPAMLMISVVPQSLMLSTPSNFTAVAISTSSVSLGWSDVSGEQNYRIDYKKSQDASYSILQTVSADVIGFTAENLLCSNTYDFRVVALGNGTLSAPSNVTSIQPLTLQTPVITLTSAERCAGESVTLTAPAGFAAYHWSNNETTQTVSVEFNGDYSVQVTDAVGCTSAYSTPVPVAFLTAPSVSGNITGDALVLEGSTDKKYSFINTPGVTFTWSYDGTGATLNSNGNEVSIDFVPGATSGELSLTASNPCGTKLVATLAITVETTITGTEEFLSLDMSIYPNPSEGKFLLDVAGYEGKYKVIILDAVGIPVYQTSGTGKTPIDLTQHSAGIYLVQVKSREKVFFKRLLLK